MKKETRKQVMKRIDKIMDSQSLGQLVCRTCGVASCCQLDHDNLLPKRSGDKFVNDGRTITYHGAKLPNQPECTHFKEHTGGMICPKELTMEEELMLIANEFMHSMAEPYDGPLL